MLGPEHQYIFELQGFTNGAQTGKKCCALIMICLREPWYQHRQFSNINAGY